MQATRASKQQNLGISIRGGGMRAVLYAGALKALVENEIEIGPIVGASAGGVVAASFAYGFSPQEMFKIYQEFKPYSIFWYTNPFKYRLIDYKPWQKFLTRIYGNARLEDLSLPIAIQAFNWRTGKLEYLTEGSIVDSLIATMAFLEPYDYQGELYFDGEVAPEYGVSKLRDLGADKILVLQNRNNNPPRNLLDKFIALLQVGQLSNLHKDNLISRPDLIIDYPTKSKSMFGRNGLNDLFEFGYQRTLSKIESVQKLVRM